LYSIEISEAEADVYSELHINTNISTGINSFLIVITNILSHPSTVSRLKRLKAATNFFRMFVSFFQANSRSYLIEKME